MLPPQDLRDYGICWLCLVCGSLVDMPRERLGGREVTGAKVAKR
jgi:hypothetical protein